TRPLLFSLFLREDGGRPDDLVSGVQQCDLPLSVGREIGVGGGVGDGECGQLIDRLAGNGREGWRAVQFIDRDGEGVGGAQRRRRSEERRVGEEYGGARLLGMGWTEV